MRKRLVKTNKILDTYKKEGTHTFLHLMWVLYKQHIIGHTLSYLSAHIEKPWRSLLHEANNIVGSPRSPRLSCDRPNQFRYWQNHHQHKVGWHCDLPWEQLRPLEPALLCQVFQRGREYQAFYVSADVGDTSLCDNPRSVSPCRADSSTETYVLRECYSWLHPWQSCQMNWEHYGIARWWLRSDPSSSHQCSQSGVDAL